MSQNVTIYPSKTANLHTNMSIHGRTWQCKQLTFLLMRLGRHEQLVGVVGGDMAIVSTVLQLMVTTDQVVASANPSHAT